MRLISWNVNGIKASQRDTAGGLRAALDALDADIICVQETKLTRETLNDGIAEIPGYEAFLSTSRSKAYSGVATYCRSAFTPVDALDGVSGVLPAHYGPQVASRLWQPPDTLEACGDLDVSLDDLDAEGRCVVTDHGAFVLFNVYFPRACAGEPDRWAYKEAFNRLIEARAKQLIGSGRHVVIAGDVNICHRPIDHCDPEKWEKEHESAFSEQYMRKWLTSFLAEEGGFMLDSFRELHPSKGGVYTCWAQLTGARATNYGTRIDYILVSASLRSACIAAGHMPEVMGSDHCPVWLQLSLDDLPPVASPARPPPLCARYMSTTRQHRLTSFFTKRAGTNQSALRVTPKQPMSDYFARRQHSESSSGGEANQQKRPSEPANEMKQPVKNKRKKANSNSQSINMTIHAFFPSNKPDKALGANGIETGDPGIQLEGAEGASAPPQPMTDANAISTNHIVLVNDAAKVLKKNHGGASQQAQVTEASSNRQSAAREWRNILKGARVPLCSGHARPCVERHVKKEGENFGRVFYCCSLPEGRVADPDSRCKFFIWREDHAKYMAQGYGLDYSLHPKFKHQRNNKGALPPLST